MTFSLNWVSCFLPFRSSKPTPPCFKPRSLLSNEKKTERLLAPTGRGSGPMSEQKHWSPKRYRSRARKGTALLTLFLSVISDPETNRRFRYRPHWRRIAWPDHPAYYHLVLLPGRRWQNGNASSHHRL